MMYKRTYILILCLSLFISCQKSNLIEDDSIKYSDALDMAKEDVKSILGISLDSRWDLISDVFSIDRVNIRNNIFRKDVLIEGYNTTLVVFIDDNDIYQVTLSIDQENNEKSIDIFMERMMKEIDKCINTKPFINIVENDDGSMREQTTTFTFAHKIFFITFNKQYLSFNLSNQ